MNLILILRITFMAKMRRKIMRIMISILILKILIFTKRMIFLRRRIKAMKLIITYNNHFTAIILNATYRRLHLGDLLAFPFPFPFPRPLSGLSFALL